MIAVCYMAMAYVLARRLNVPSYPRATFRSIMQAFGKASVPLVMPIVVVGGIFGGVFSPTEAGAVAAGYGLFVTMVIFRTITLLILQVIMRYVIRTPLIWVEELTSYTLAFLVLWGAACYIRSWQHIRVDSLFNVLPSYIRMVLLVGINSLIVYFGYLLLTSGHQLAMLGAADLSDSGYFNLFWPRQAMTTGGALIMLQGFNNVLRVMSGQPGPLLTGGQPEP